jgi:hypothetical protein
MISPRPQQSVGPGRQLPQFASGLLTAVDEAWNNLSSLAKCSSHSDMCAIAGARIAKELHKKGATTGADAFESFKSSISRFTPSPDTHVDIPLPSHQASVIPMQSQRQYGGVAQFSSSKIEESSFGMKFETILKKVQWSPTAHASNTSRPTLSSGSAASSPGATTVASKRPVPESFGRTTPQATKRIKH